MAFMSLALSFIAELSLEELLDLFSESSLGALIILTVFLVIPRHILGIVLVGKGLLRTLQGGTHDTCHRTAMHRCDPAAPDC